MSPAVTPPPVCVYCACNRSNKSSPATDSPDTPSPLPDRAFQLAVEAKELVEGVCSITADDQGTDYSLEVHDIAGHYVVLFPLLRSSLDMATLR